ncbi:helix-turn-helix domain-containing protein [Halioxenophilus aromaticivorans]|uniref:Helix-turn-helix domain-containing protein n=1 Tax=Halioxenophilus aromaticivorans TaxID=1306992 RepID=A0AAV3TXV9_9ALTE
MVTTTIPTFGLYGENTDIESPVAVHVEEIATRSRDRDWVIKPHRHRKFHQILCIFDSQLSVQLDDKKHQLEGTGLVTVPKGVVHGFEFKPNSDGVVITFSDHIFQASEGGSATMLPRLFQNSLVLKFSDNDDQMPLLKQYSTLLRQEFSSPYRGKDTVLLSLVNLLLITIARQWEAMSLNSVTPESTNRLLESFKRLVELHYKDHWRVQEYASAINTSTATLNRLCQSQLGTSAKQIILDRLIAEAKRRLIFTQQPLEQIAYHLGFKDAAYFSRLFKKQEGRSPKEYRLAAEDGD